MRAMKGWLAFAVTLLARQATAQAQIAQRWPLDPGGSVRIVNPAGRIRVLGWDADSVAVSGRLGPRAGRFSAAGDPHVRTLAVDTGPGAAELEIHVPRRATVWVKSATATIEVDGMEGTLDLASQDLGASTLSGRIVVRAAGWQRGGTGVQRGRFESVTGDVRFEGEVGRGGVVEVESQSGTIELRLPASTVAEFDLLTIGGSITNHLGEAQPRPRAGGTGLELRFATGVGGAQVTARSFKGRILLEPK